MDVSDETTCGFDVKVDGIHQMDINVQCGVQVKNITSTKFASIYSNLVNDCLTWTVKSTETRRRQLRVASAKNNMEALLFWSKDSEVSELIQARFDPKFTDEFIKAGEEINRTYSNFASLPIENIEESIAKLSALRAKIEKQTQLIRDFDDLIYDLNIDVSRGKFLKTDSDELQTILDGYKAKQGDLDITHEFSRLQEWKIKAIENKVKKEKADREAASKSASQNSTISLTDTLENVSTQSVESTLNSTSTPVHEEL